MLSVLCSVLVTAAAAPVQKADRPDSAALVEQARLFVPQFEGDHKYFLTTEEERDVRAAANILEAAMALDAENTYALWWHGHCSVLLGENEKNRGRLDSARSQYESALASFAVTIEQDPSYYWARYSRAMAEANLGRFWDAIGDFDAAVEITDAAMAESDADQMAPFVRFKARQWRADTRMRIFEFDTARTEFARFYADNGNNAWDLGYSIAETYLRESDLERARLAYEEIIANPEFVKFDSTYAELAYVAGLVGADELAVERIEKALELEFKPTLYPRLWLWILSAGETRAKAQADLAEFLQYPPDDLSAWDLTLGKFLIGEGSTTDFLAQAQAEQARRMVEAVALDDLMCEVWFYIGIRSDRAGEDAEALDAYRQALAFRPAQHKWEWTYARHGLAMVAARSGAAANPGFEIAAGSLSLAAGSALNGVDRALTGQVETLTVHTPGAAQPAQGGAVDVSSLHPGDLIRCTLRTEDGSMRALRIVVDAR